MTRALGPHTLALKPIPLGPSKPPGACEVWSAFSGHPQPPLQLLLESGSRSTTENHPRERERESCARRQFQRDQRKGGPFFKGHSASWSLEKEYAPTKSTRPQLGAACWKKTCQACSGFSIINSDNVHVKASSFFTPRPLHPAAHGQ